MGEPLYCDCHPHEAGHGPARGALMAKLEGDEIVIRARRHGEAHELRLPVIVDAGGEIRATIPPTF